MSYYNKLLYEKLTNRMKKFFLFLILIIVLLFINTINSFTQFTYLKCKVHNSENHSISISCPIDGAFFYGFSQKVKLDSMGEFQNYLDIAKPGLLLINHQYSPYGSIAVRLFLNSGDSISVIIDPKDDISQTRIYGSNSKGHQLYNTLISTKDPKPNHSFCAQFTDSLSAKDIEKKIQLLKKGEIIKFDNLLEQGEIDSVFYKAVINDINFYYATFLSNIIKSDYFGTRFPADHKLYNKEFTTGYDRLWDELFNNYPPNSKNAMQTNWFYEYAWEYMWYNGFYLLQTQNRYNVDSLNNDFHGYMINSYKSCMTGKNLELSWASYIHNMIASFRTEKELIKYFDNFKNQYPNSPYLKFLEPEIEKVISFHNISKEINQQEASELSAFEEIPVQYSFNKSNKVNILPKHREINSLDDALKPFRGKVVYVDIWATWCPPCLIEFNYNKELKKFLNENNIEMLYISIDDDKYQKKWRDFIRVYNLSGHHIRANDQLENDIKIKTKYFGIPWYLIVDKYGNIVEYFARRPGEKEKLYEQLLRHIE